MRLNNYIRTNAERISTMSDSQDIAQILSGGQDITKSRAYTLREAIEVAADSFDDETACEYPELYPQWESGVNYSAGQRVNRYGRVYTVLQDHTSQTDWPPEDAPSLFAKSLTSETEILPWEQPDSTNPYMMGDRMIYLDGKTYESLIDNNVWSPEAYPAGWKIVEEA